MGRNDVKNKVEEFIKDAAKRPRENHNKKASQSPTRVQEDNGSQSSNDRKASNLSLDNNVYSHIGCNVLIAAAVVVAVFAIFVVAYSQFEYSNKSSNVDSDNNAYIEVRHLLIAAVVSVLGSILKFIVQKFDEFLKKK